MIAEVNSVRMMVGDTKGKIVLYTENSLLVYMFVYSVICLYRVLYLLGLLILCGGEVYIYGFAHLQDHSLLSITTRGILSLVYWRRDVHEPRGRYRRRP